MKTDISPKITLPEDLPEFTENDKLHKISVEF
jgi:hypothetical protein